MKQISSLAADIGEVLKDEHHLTPSPDSLKLLGTNVGIHVTSTLGERIKGREVGRLWASDIGEKCPRKTWYKFHHQDQAEALPSGAKFKFLYGNLIEELVLFLAKQAGHEVTGEQERVEYDAGNGWVVSGRLDAVIDGALVDIKSSSSYGYKEYTTKGLTHESDTFGYLWQLAYYAAFYDGPFDDTGFVFVDKQNGHIGYVPCTVPSKEKVVERINNISEVISEPTELSVPKAYSPVAEGTSGNERLGVGCSYCAFKYTCWPGLRTFIYSNGPKYLTTVVKTPKVYEVPSG